MASSAVAAFSSVRSRFQSSLVFVPSLLRSPLPSHLQLRRRHPPPARNNQIRAARTESSAVSMDFRAPDFELPEPLTGKTWKLDDFESYPALLVMFICNHCPFVIHLKKDIVKLTNCFMEKGLAVVAISSNSTVTHPQDGPEFMAEDAKQFNYAFPYLFDEKQDIARAFGAVCTPDFFLFKKDGRRPFELFYHGQFDDSRPRNNVPVTGSDLSHAIECALSGQPLTVEQKRRLNGFGNGVSRFLKVKVTATRFALSGWATIHPSIVARGKVPFFSATQPWMDAFLFQIISIFSRVFTAHGSK